MSGLGVMPPLPTTDQAPLCRVRQKESMLQAYSLQVGSRHAPADAEKTERLSGASRPSAKVMHSANRDFSILKQTHRREPGAIRCSTFMRRFARTVELIFDQSIGQVFVT